MLNPFQRGPLMAPADGDGGGGSVEQSRNRRELINIEQKIVFRNLILRYAERLNEGNNGLICSLDLSRVEEEEMNELEELGILDPGQQERVVKLLKISSTGGARNEFQAQDFAWNAIQKVQKEGRQNLASVPRPRVYASLDVTPEMAATFQSKFQFRLTSGHVEAFVMDRVRGRDVATIMFQEILLRHPNSQYKNDRESVESMDFTETAQRAYGLLGLASRFRGDVGGELDPETKHLQNLQAQKIYDFLGDNGLRIHPPLLDAMRNSIKSFHDAGLVWRDGHQRNLMIAGEYDADKIAAGAEPGKPFIIDFGGSEILKHRPVQEEVVKDFEAIDKLVDVFAKGKTTKFMEKAREESRITTWQKKGLRMLAHPTIGAKLRSIGMSWESGAIDMPRLAVEFAKGATKSDDLLPAVFAMMEIVPGRRDDIRQALDQYQGQLTNISDQRAVQSLLKEL